ncbi:Lysine-specific histone demethylase 1A [Oopsacas minuta]|uniref:Lysine-specific histone demethylase 1A n=1 Tax=Oopsacas minuta TaxID=111878 RepID=A0AAV7JC78_9METZ|nr:Lysine-specific histone demethylase 1A [Oopsacas minuta]
MQCDYLTLISKNESLDAFPLTDDNLSSESDGETENFVPTTLDYAATVSRLPASTLKIFLYIRNHILYLWHNESRIELTFEKVISRLHPPYNKYHSLAKDIYDYLLRYSYINFGIFSLIKPVTKCGKKVIVLGAGMSGLCAARQLENFGFDVVILEARDRVGGRIHTFQVDHLVGDLGAMVVTGLGGNPIAVFDQQLNLDLSKIKQQCPLYNSRGGMIPRDKDKIVETEFNQLLEAASELSHQMNFNSFRNENLSLGNTFDQVLHLQNVKTKRAFVQHQSIIIQIQESIETVLNDLLVIEDLIRTRTQLLSNVKEIKCEVFRQDEVSTTNQEYSLQLEDDINSLFSEYDRLKGNLTIQESRLQLLNENKMNEVYLSISDMKMLEWHIANLEFANATIIGNLSLQHWDQDDDFEFTGSHLSLQTGYSTLPDAISKGLNIHHSIAARNVQYDTEQIQITAENVKDKTTLSFECDIVVCTIPLGVLKHPECITFQPPLPADKQQSIANMGFGVLNKVVLCFKQRFWNPDIHHFGYVNPRSRGEMFLFWNVMKTPVLLALIAGKAALENEKLKDTVVLGKAMSVLHKIFGEDSVPEPFEWCISHWGNDPFSFGSYSYVSPKSSGKDYDQLAMPVLTPEQNNALNSDNPKEELHLPRLFFAGEHTMRNYPATVHGAILSGFREAGRIADLYLT